MDIRLDLAQNDIFKWIALRVLKQQPALKRSHRKLIQLFNKSPQVRLLDESIRLSTHRWFTFQNFVLHQHVLDRRDRHNPSQK